MIIYFKIYQMRVTKSLSRKNGADFSSENKLDGGHVLQYLFCSWRGQLPQKFEVNSTAANYEL